MVLKNLICQLYNVCEDYKDIKKMFTFFLFNFIFYKKGYFKEIIKKKRNEKKEVEYRCCADKWMMTYEICVTSWITSKVEKERKRKNPNPNIAPLTS